ncbi:MAG: DUF4139 domain-containing protein, partial [Terriglobia bacterium]
MRVGSISLRWRLGVEILLCLMLAAECYGQAMPARPTLETSTPNDRKELSITVYRDGAAVVRDTRQVELPEGAVDLKFSGVARQLVPDSVRVAGITQPGGLALFGQTYAYDLLNPEHLLQAYVGKTLTLVLTHRRNGSDVERRVEATLVAANPGPVWRIGGKIETGLKVDHYIFPAIPAGLSATPSLVLSLENRHAGEQSVRVSYLTNNLHWNANYAIEVKPDWNTADLSARATIHNQSGADYDQAALQLVAGEVRRVNESGNYGVAGGVPGGVIGGMIGSLAPQPMIFAPPPVPFSGYHLY